jgi:myo-inositol 2-dehydrogenase/D-chiro-inositol 1-dehydrogenase
MTRIGFIGTGNFARQHAEVLQELGMNISACYGTHADKTAEFSRIFNCEIMNDPFTLVSKKRVDVVYLVVPPYAYDGLVELKLIEQRIPFFCEKPLGLNLATCQKVAKAIEENHLITSSGYLLRYEPLFSEVKKILARNKLSTVRICSYNYMPEVHWWRKKQTSGGPMLESGIHYIDLLRYLIGEISTVSAMTTQGIASNNYPDCDIYDSMEALVKFQTGCIGSVGMTHLLNKIQARNDFLEIYGEDFSLKIDLYKLRYQNEAAVYYKESTDADWKFISNASSKKSLLRLESSAFLSAVQYQQPESVRSSYPCAVQSLKVALAMNQSAEQKKLVEI